MSNRKDLMAEARGLETSGDFKAAATLYQEMLQKDPGDREAIKRSLIAFRRLQDFPGELSVIRSALAAISKKDQSAQGEWLAAHPQAAKLGRTMLRSLGGKAMTGFGMDAFVQQLLRRKDLVERKVSGGDTNKSKTRKAIAQRGKASETKAPGGRIRTQKIKSPDAVLRKKEVAKRRAVRLAVTVKRRKEAAKKKALAKQKKEELKLQKLQRLAAVTEEKRRAAQAKADEGPLFFVINILYRKSPEKGGVALSKHSAFLRKYSEVGAFLLTGKAVSKTGEFILARGKNQASVERIMQKDPVVEGEFASYDISEFRSNKAGKTWRELS